MFLKPLQVAFSRSGSRIFRNQYALWSVNIASDFFYLHRFSISFNRITNGPVLVTPMFLRSSRPFIRRAIPLTSLIIKVAPTFSCIPLIAATHFETSLQLHSFANFVLSSCTQSGLSNYFTRKESLQSPNVERFFVISLPLVLSKTTSSSSLRKNLI